MQNIVRSQVTNCEPVMVALLTKANQEGQKEKAFSVSIRMAALSIHIIKNQLSPEAAGELLMKEALKYEQQSQAVSHG